MPEVRHFLDLDQIPSATLREILERGRAYKAGAGDRPLAGKTLAMIFEKPSTRTRVSFEVGMRALGGEVIVLDHNDTQLGRGETVADTARVLSRYVDAIMLRTKSHATLLEFARHATVPVINGLTDRTHPCQLMADVMTFEEHRGAIARKVVAWSGDLNNLARTWTQAAVQFGFELRLACPEGQNLTNAELAWVRDHDGHVQVLHDPRPAAAGAHCVVTDTWVSMGEVESRERLERLAPFRVDADLMRGARPDALFMHCLPAHRGREVTEEVIDGPWSVVWDEAENRLHAQKGVLAWCLA